MFPYFILFYLISSLIKQTNCLTSSPTFTTTPKFITGIASVSITSTSTALTNMNFMVTYPTALPSVKYSVALGIYTYGYKLNGNSNYFMAFVLSQATTTGFTMNVSTNNDSYIISTPKISYMTADPSVTEPLSFSYTYIAPASLLQSPFDSLVSINFTAQTGLSFDITHNHAIIVFQHLFDLSSTTYKYSLQVNATVVNQTFFNVRLFSTILNMKLKAIGFSKIVFDKTQMQNRAIFYFIYGLAEQYNSGLINQVSINPYSATNIMVGLNNFNISNNNSQVKFSASRGSLTSFTTNGYFYFGFNYIYVAGRTCPTTTSFFSPFDGLCYDNCLNGLYKNLTNTTNKLCSLCHYSCATCSSYTVCLTCNSANKRYLNGTSCLPLPGYYQNNVPLAPSCAVALPDCATCSNSTTCLTCQTNFYLSPLNQCKTCSQLFTNCLSCSSSPIVACTVCSMGYTLNTSGQCQVCSNFIANCIACTNTTFCQTCMNPLVPALNSSICGSTSCSNADCKACSANDSLLCLQCQNVGYVPVSSVCQTVCGDSIKADVQQCDDGNTIDGDGCNYNCTIGNNNSCSSATPFISPATGACVSNCPDLYYNNYSNFVCQSCHYSCQTCLSSINCISCSPTSNRYFNNSLCIPLPGYFDNPSNISAQPCSSPCSECLSATNCTACVLGYYLQARQCSLCSSILLNCANCTNSTICDDCNSGYTWNSVNSTCDGANCNDTNCLICTIYPNICEGCINGYKLIDNLCATVCGDGILAGIEQCDDNNTADGDGCNSDCTTGNNNNCPKSTPYRDPVSSLCSASCPDGFFANPAAYTCLACHYSCSTCSNAIDCLGCSSLSHRQLVGSACPPLPGYYDPNVTDALPCVSPCATCSSASVCLTCVVGTYLSGSACNLCSTITPFCSDCLPDGSACISCQLGYVYNPTTLLCDVVPCNDALCLSCPNSMEICLQCSPGYQPVNGQCQHICGDFYKTTQQECDDGNSVDKDGCSSSCKIEPDFVCEPNAINTSGSSCFYTGTVSVQLFYMEKVDGKNEIQIVLELFPSDLAFWDQVNFIDMIHMQSPVPVINVQVTHNADGTLSIDFQYAADIQGSPLNLVVNPSNSAYPGLMRAVPSSNTLVVDPNDNEAAYFYDESAYKIASIVSLLCLAVSATSLVFFVLGLISGKMVGVEMMAVVQISFFALMTLSQLNPCFAALSQLKFVNGYNSLNNNHLEDQLSPNESKGIFLFSRFTENFNFTAAIVVVPLLVALVAFILSKTAFKNSEKVELVFQRALGEYTLNGLLFSGYIISVAFSLQVMYGIKSSSDFIGKISLAECSIFLALLVGYFIFLLLKPQFFGEFVESFKKDKLSSKMYNFLLVERVLVGGCLIFLLAISMEAVVPMAVFLLTAVFVVVKRPYRENSHNFRAVANMSISCVVLAIYLVFRMSSAENRNKPIFVYLPLIVCILLIICVLYNSIFIIISIYKKCKYGSISAKQLDGVEQLTKLRSQMQSTSGSNSVRILNPMDSSTPLIKSQLMQPHEIRKKINLSSLKKQITKVSKSPSAGQVNLQNLAQSIYFRNNSLSNQDHPAQQDLNQYDGI